MGKPARLKNAPERDGWEETRYFLLDGSKSTGKVVKPKGRAWEVKTNG